MPLTARDIMIRELITVTPATTLTRFARICTEDSITGCPVVGVDGRLLGIVSRTDLLERLLEGRHDYASNPDFRGIMGLGEEGVYGIGGAAADSEEELFGQVDDIMQTDPLTFGPDMPVKEIARTMAAERTHRVLVTEGDRLLGIITSLDILARVDGD